MVIYWIVFGLLFPFFLFAIPYGEIELAKICKIQMNKEKALGRRIRTIIYLWLWNIFIMTIVISNVIWQFILGGMLMMIIFTNLAQIFTYPRQRNKLENLFMLCDFIIGIALTIYLIYIIPNESIQNIVIPVVSAVYGGLLTLVGVSLTIKKSEKDRKDAETEKAKE